MIVADDIVAVIPARTGSQRVPGKNFRCFWNGLSLVELKIICLQRAGIRRIVLSTNDPSKEVLARHYGVDFQLRPEHLCGDVTNLQELFAFSLRDLAHALVFWAHPTSPFLTPSSIGRAMAFSLEHPDTCLVSVQTMREFLWKADQPLNYDPANQPRSQDLEPLFRITGGIHMGRGRNFIAQGAVTFSPAAFFPLSTLESLDVNTAEDWHLAQILAPRVAATII